MKIKIFYPNSNGKVEFTKEELERELQKAYDEGFSDGKLHNHPWSITYGNNGSNGYCYTTKATPCTNDLSTATISNTDSNCNNTVTLKSCAYNDKE